jgi:hypothetical protein
LSGPSYGPVNIYRNQALDAALWWRRYTQVAPYYHTPSVQLGDLRVPFRFWESYDWAWTDLLPPVLVFTLFRGDYIYDLKLQTALLTDGGSIEFYTLAVVRQGWWAYEGYGINESDLTQYGSNAGSPTAEISAFTLQMGIYTGSIDFTDWKIDQRQITDSVGIVESLPQQATVLGVSVVPFQDFLPYTNEQAIVLYNYYLSKGWTVPPLLEQTAMMVGNIQVPKSAIILPGIVE